MERLPEILSWFKFIDFFLFFSTETLSLGDKDANRVDIFSPDFLMILLLITILNKKLLRKLMGLIFQDSLMQIA